jgi:hypothetical protein
MSSRVTVEPSPPTVPNRDESCPTMTMFEPSEPEPLMIIEAAFAMPKAQFQTKAASCPALPFVALMACEQEAFDSVTEEPDSVSLTPA